MYITDQTQRTHGDLWRTFFAKVQFHYISCFFFKSKTITTALKYIPWTVLRHIFNPSRTFRYLAVQCDNLQSLKCLDRTRRRFFFGKIVLQTNISLSTSKFLKTSPHLGLMTLLHNNLLIKIDYMYLRGRRCVKFLNISCFFL